jgi:hypothetical protein
MRLETPVPRYTYGQKNPVLLMKQEGRESIRALPEYEVVNVNLVDSSGYFISTIFLLKLLSVVVRR